jgi:hypothetical protein
MTRGRPNCLHKDRDLMTVAGIQARPGAPKGALPDLRRKHSRYALKSMDMKAGEYCEIGALRQSERYRSYGFFWVRRRTESLESISRGFIRPPALPHKYCHRSATFENEVVHQ